MFGRKQYIPCESKPIKIKTHHFSLKLLSVMHDLEAERTCNCCSTGVGVDEILKHMNENFNIDGDVRIQIIIGLQQLLVQGLIVKKCVENEVRYKLVGPIASVMQTSENSVARSEETRRVLKIFWKDSKCKGNCNNVQRKTSEDTRCKKYVNCVSKSRHALDKKRNIQKKLNKCTRNDRGEPICQ